MSTPLYLGSWDLIISRTISLNTFPFSTLPIQTFSAPVSTFARNTSSQFSVEETQMVPIKTERRVMSALPNSESWSTSSSFAGRTISYPNTYPSNTSMWYFVISHHSNGISTIYSLHLQPLNQFSKARVQDHLSPSASSKSSATTRIFSISLKISRAVNPFSQPILCKKIPGVGIERSRLGILGR